MIKPIKVAADYEGAMREIAALVALDPAPGSPEGDRLEVLAVLVEDYENRTVPRTPPTPLEALQFRMEQQELTPRDLVAYLGSRSKVSEVLSAKRPLSLTMMRALWTGLGIPAEVLLQAPEQEDSDVDWSRFPIKEMISRGWIPASEPAENYARALQEFFAAVGRPRDVVAYYRKSDHVRSARPIDSFALVAWTTQVLRRAGEVEDIAPYVPGTINQSFMEELARLSAFESGPSLAKEFLANHGILLIAEPHLPRTRLDGAAIRSQDDRPVIGMTLRFDRVDNFWYVLMHELAHVRLHWDMGMSAFYDDLEAEGLDEKEREADTVAGETLIPDDIWRTSPASRVRSAAAAELLARQLRIHPAIVAGRMRRHFGSYRVLSKMVGHGQVRRWFPEVSGAE